MGRRNEVTMITWAKQVYQRKVSAEMAARELKVSVRTVYRWVEKVKQEKKDV